MDYYKDVSFRRVEDVIGMPVTFKHQVSGDVRDGRIFSVREKVAEVIDQRYVVHLVDWRHIEPAR